MQTMIIFTVTILFSIMAVSVYASSNGIIVGGEAYAQTDIKDFTIGSLVTQTGSLSESGKHRGAITSFAVEKFNVDIGTGALPALNELYFGSYDYFYRDSLRTVIDDTISDYDSNTNFDAINDQYTTTDYPFVYNKEGHVIAHGFSSEHITLLDSNGAITSGVDINTLQDSDILPEEIYRLFEGENSPEEIWWQYTFLNPDTNSDAIKRSLLVYHSESGLIVGAGYYPILNNDASHIPPLEAVINTANGLTI